MLVTLHTENLIKRYSFRNGDNFIKESIYDRIGQSSIGMLHTYLIRYGTLADVQRLLA